MAKIDLVRRECEDIGTSLKKTDTNARSALAEIHTKAISSEAEPTALGKELDAFREKFNIDPKVAPYRQPEAV